jgi:hypothetical protein
MNLRLIKIDITKPEALDWLMRGEIGDNGRCIEVDPGTTRFLVSKMGRFVTSDIRIIDGVAWVDFPCWKQLFPLHECTCAYYIYIEPDVDS